jgi:hypothetical protein
MLLPKPAKAYPNPNSFKNFFGGMLLLVIDRAIKNLYCHTPEGEGKSLHFLQFILFPVAVPGLLKLG